MDPKTRSYVTSDAVHVQFFGRPVSTSWVSRSAAEKLTSESVGHEERKVKSRSLGLAMRQAEAAFDKGPAARSRLVRRNKEDDEEEDEDDEEVVDAAVDDGDYTPERRSKRRRITRAIAEAVEADENNTTEDDEEEDSVVGATEDVCCARSRKTEGEEAEYEMSEYELIRQSNIERREQRFQELQLSDSKQRLADSFGKTAAANGYNASKRGLAAAAAKRKEAANAEPVRKSLRLQKIDAGSGLQLPDKEPAVYAMSAADDRPRPPLRTLQLEEIVLSEDDVGEKRAFLKGVVAAAAKGGGGRPAGPSFSADVAASMSKLKLTVSYHVVSVSCEPRIFCVSVGPRGQSGEVAHPVDGHPPVGGEAAGGRRGQVGRRRPVGRRRHGVEGQRRPSLPGTYSGETWKRRSQCSLLQPHSRPVNSLEFSRFDPLKLISTSYEGTVRCFDLARERSTLLYGDDDEDFYTCYHKQVDANTFLVALGSAGRVGLVDARRSNTKLAAQFALFERAAVKMVDVHPTQSHVFLCPNNKAGCATFDMRAVGDGQLLPPLLSLQGHTRALSSALFSPVTGRSVVTVCYDNKVRLFSTGVALPAVPASHSIPHDNQTGRWLTTFKVQCVARYTQYVLPRSLLQAEWHPRRDDLFLMGSMRQPRQIDVFSSCGAQVASLRNEDCLGSICSIVKCHPSLDVVAGGNSSGRVHVFM